MDDELLEDRLRKHLDRVADKPAPQGLEARILARTGSEKPAVNWAKYGVLVAVTALTLILVFTLSGHQVSNTFSNISNGLTKPG